MTIPISIFCPFCKKHTSLAMAQKEVSAGLRYGTTTIELLWERAYKDAWWIGICNACHNPVLVHNEGDIVYPTPMPSPSDKNIPDHIRKDLDEAKKCLSASCPRACATMARRAIQNTCLDKGAGQGDLVTQLSELATKGIITDDIKKWGTAVRWVGNDAAHPDKGEVSGEDADDILKLAEQFLHVIYVTPAVAKERMAKRGKTV